MAFARVGRTCPFGPMSNPHVVKIYSSLGVKYTESNDLIYLMVVRVVIKRQLSVRRGRILPGFCIHEILCRGCFHARGAKFYFHDPKHRAVRIWIFCHRTCFRFPRLLHKSYLGSRRRRSGFVCMLSFSLDCARLTAR